MNPQLWLTGDAVVDLIPENAALYQKLPGGAPANVAVGVARLDGSVGFFGRVGNDPLGRFLKETLANESVDVQCLKLDDERRTSTVLVDLDEHGERTFTFMVKPSADQFTQIEDIPQFQAGQWMHFCSIALANEPSRGTTLEAVTRLKKAGGFIAFDPNLRDEVWSDPTLIQSVVLDAMSKADVIKISEEELTFLTGQSNIETGLDWLQARYQIPVMIVTLGGDGALVRLADGDEFTVAGFKAKVVDTTGAGDAFVGGLLASLIQTNTWNQKETIIKAVKNANGCGALAVTAKGAMTALPTKVQLDAFIEQ